MAYIELEDVIVDFPVFDSKSFRKALFDIPTGGSIRQGNKNDIIIRAVDGVSMHIKEGDKYGLIGHNGAGKSTLLRVMAGIYEPTAGTLNVEGTVSPMFNISLGLDPDDSGFENLKSIAMYMGLSPKDLKEIEPEIVDFCELGDFMHLPLRTYSSGMQARLGFAIATAINPEILLLDEWLGAGDARFMKKANKRINDMVERSSILVLASHSEALIKNNCDKALLIEHGKVIADGEINHVLDEYNAIANAGLD